MGYKIRNLEFTDYTSKFIKIDLCGYLEKDLTDEEVECFLNNNTLRIFNDLDIEYYSLYQDYYENVFSKQAYILPKNYVLKVKTIRGWETVATLRADPKSNIIYTIYNYHNEM